MPELPEVQTMINGLKKEVLNRTIVKVWTDWEKLFKNINFLKFKKEVKGAKIINIYRKGKIICFELDNNKIILIHPKMTGHFLIGKWIRKKHNWEPLVKGVLNDPMNRFIHLMFWLGDEDKSSSSRFEPPQGGEEGKENFVFFDFASARVDNGLMMAFSDMRKFARIELWNKKQLINAEMIQKLGPDALQLKIHQLTKILANSLKKIKQVLMDQELIAGIGNIYADEILFQAKINPFRIAKELSKNEIEKIYQAIKPILKKAIKLGATSISDFRDIEGGKGQFQNELKVYSRQGQKCFVCQKIIKREKMGGRSAHFCPNCQK